MQKQYEIMEIKSEKEFREYQQGCEELIRKGAALGGMDYLSSEEKEEYVRLSDAVIAYESAYYPLPGSASTLLSSRSRSRRSVRKQVAVTP